MLLAAFFSLYQHQAIPPLLCPISQALAPLCFARSSTAPTCCWPDGGCPGASRNQRCRPRADQVRIGRIMVYQIFQSIQHAPILLLLK
jgi:hypothetical protein